MKEITQAITAASVQNKEEKPLHFGLKSCSLHPLHDQAGISTAKTEGV